ncbi:IrrE-type HTH domain-containing protein [Paenibacillus sp. 32O-W]|uniref:ImmA/IrrE family metallo-endopeptidase n=1 Tax=Paenibacillus sp. 32O-W TaxID=1695218 RepID=UPI00071F2012|nr:ImmA/IrrE family metallo-endopeptidase [Paenibacillus sp. 32O-W]ALS27153.1 IrrE-type HTH domain-containing protein [Paenibacillus sp. 32O-W]
MSHIKSIVNKLINRHKTNDPFEIAALKNITILFNYLGETLGFFSSYKRAKFIHINNYLDEPMRRFVCAHELGHAVLHPRVNTPFLKSSTLFSVNRLEREANEFAVELLLPDEVVREYQTIYEAAAAYGVPEEVVELKRLDGSWLRKFWHDERSYFCF